jgi:hypothetical protein
MLLWVAIVFESGRHLGILTVKPGTNEFNVIITGVRKIVNDKKLDLVWNYLQDIYKADVNAQDNFGSTALHYASKKGELEILDLLLDCKANASLKDKDGKLPVDVARDEKVRSRLLEDKAGSPSQAEGGHPTGDVELGFPF